MEDTRGDYFSPTISFSGKKDDAQDHEASGMLGGKPKEKKNKYTFVDFTQETTFHGIKYIFEKPIYYSRR